MPNLNNNLGNRRRRQRPRANSAPTPHTPPRATRARLNPRRLPRRVVGILDGAHARDVGSVDYGHSRTIQWTQVNDATPNRRHALWHSLGDNNRNIDATLTELIRDRGGNQPTKLRLTIEPTDTDSPAAIAHVLAGIKRHNDQAADNQKIEIVGSPEVRALRDGWIDANRLVAVQAQLGRKATAELMADAMDTDHPSRIRTMVDNLANANFQPLADNSSVVLGDALRAWGRIDRAMESLLTPQDSDPTNLDPPAGAFNQPRDVAWLRAQVRDLMRNLEPSTTASLNQLLVDIANYRRGLRAPLLTRLGSEYTDPPTLETMLGLLPLDTSGIPAVSVVAQAADVLGLLRGTTPTLTVSTLARSGADLVGTAIAAPDRTTLEYQRILDTLRRRHQRAGGQLDEAGITQLADLIDTARRQNKRPRLVTTDHDVMRTLWGLSANDEVIPENGLPRPNIVTIEGVQLDLRAVPSRRNDYPHSTQVGDFAAAQTDTLQFGTPVSVISARGTKRDAYLFGYTPEGLARVLLRPKDGSTPDVLYTLSANETIEANDTFPSLAEDAIGGTPRTQQWNSRNVSLTTLAAQQRPAPGVQRMIYDNIQRMRDLRTRNVAGSDLTADQYTNLIAQGNFKSYIVGGATRDILLGGDPQDIDFASTMPAIDSYNAIVNAGLARKNPKPNDPNDLAIRRNVPFGSVQVEADHPTGLDIISTHDDHNASLRLDLDALARDFTVNAVYYDIADDALIDPTGQGLADLYSQTVRFVQGTAAEVLKEQPIMVARWMRMLQKGFTPAEAGDTAAALEWLDHHSRNMEPLVAKRFVDRMKTSKVDAEALVQQIFQNVQPTDKFPNPRQTALDAIRRIYG